MPEGARRLTYRDAVNQALADEMDADGKVVLLGEDIGGSGGPFKTSAGLLERFGDRRVLDTPISETGIIGTGIGLAINGYRPVVEIMFADFLAVALDQVINQAAKYHFLSDGQVSVPLTIRAIGGAGGRFGAQHSATAESWMLTVPGLQIVSASGPLEAYGLLRGAIRSNNPVVFFEHKVLYGEAVEVDGQAMQMLPIDRCRRVRGGRDLTIVASLRMVRAAQEAALALEAEGVSAAVIDMCCLAPFETETIIDSVKRTGRLLTVEEQTVIGGWGGEVVATVAGLGLHLHAPPRRMGLPQAPLSASAVLEDLAIPTSAAIAAVGRGLCSVS
jgi:pyruvate dehydrogenase E1 component beta subunit